MKSTVSEKGQVTIPKRVRKRRGSSPLDAVVGILPPMDVDKSLGQMRGKPWNAAQDAPCAKRRR